MVTTAARDVEGTVAEFTNDLVRLRQEIGTMIVGQETIVEGVLMCLLGGGPKDYRWVNGTETTTPLWPWPMNSRIRAATASAGRYTGPCLDCVGGRDARTTTDVTADIEALLGTIPAYCKRT